MYSNLNQTVVFYFLFFFVLTVSFTSQAEWVNGIFRVNSNISTGQDSLQKIAEDAKEKDLKFIVISDQFRVKAKYGIAPFRNLFSYSKSRPDVVTFGIQKYLEEIKKINESQKVLFIPAVDVAPAYWWEGSIFKGNLKCLQYSEQLTVLGGDNVSFYEKLPVINNDSWGFNLMAFLPLILCLPAWIFFKKSQIKYDDAQGNKIVFYKRGQLIPALVFFFISICWVADNQPFRKFLDIHPYGEINLKPFQNLINYCERNNAGVFWSAPEAAMKQKLGFVTLNTEDYLDDVVKSQKHNGFAGIYGDAYSAHLPGKEWDIMLGEYIRGKRKKIPFITGELDYHSEGREINLIQTVVFVKKQSEKTITDAIINGHSYAVKSLNDSICKLNNATLSGKQKSILPGEKLRTKQKQLTLKVAGEFNKLLTMKYELVTIMNGKEINRQAATEKTFQFEVPISFSKKGYIRFYLETPVNKNAFLIANPFFVNPE